MTEWTFQGTVTVDGTPHQVSLDGTLSQVTTPPAGGGGTTGGGGGTTGGGGGTTGGGGGSTPPPSGAGQCYFGIWDTASVDWSSGDPVGTWAGVQKFSAAPVKSASYFAAWLSPQPAQLYQLAKQNGATVYLNLEPWNTWGGAADPKMADIAAGKYDSYLTAVGNAIKASGSEQWFTFAHEMNGNGWYPWQQSGGVSPAQWVKAWQHVCDVIRAAAGGNAKAVWCPNNIDVGSCKPYWPGDNYVDIAGFDGYLNTDHPGATYASFVAQTPAEIRTLTTSKPIWNAETGVSTDGNRAQRYAQFIADMKSDGLLGFTQWNEQTYQLNSTEIAAVTAAVNKWNNG